MMFTAPITHRPLPQPLVLGHFLPWYTGQNPTAFSLPPQQTQRLTVPALEPWRHWRDRRSEYGRTHPHQPLWGEYDSRDPAIVRRQIESAKAHGLDGFVVNLYGCNSAENVLGLSFLNELRQYNRAHIDAPLVYMLSLDAQAQWPTEGKAPVSIEEDFAYLRQTWVTEACLQREGHLPLMIFPYDRPSSDYRAAADRVFGPNRYDLLWLNQPADECSDAAYAWVRPDTVEPDGRWLNPDDCGDGFLSHFYRQCNSNPKLRYIVGGVWPGFNDHLVRWAWSDKASAESLRPRVMCRQTTRGPTLDLTWQAAAAYLRAQRAGESGARLPLPIIQIVTWNDWAEATQVEPSVDFGCSDLELCRKYVDLLRGCEC